MFAGGCVIWELAHIHTPRRAVRSPKIAKLGESPNHQKLRGFQSFRAIGAAATALHARGHCCKVFLFYFFRDYLTQESRVK